MRAHSNRWHLGNTSNKLASVERRERAQAHYADPTWWDSVFDTISSGKAGLAAICRHYDIPYTTTITATEKSPDLAQKLEAARQAYRVTSREQIETELQHIAFVNAADIFDDDWNIKNKKELPENVQRAIKGIEKTETSTEDGTTTKVKVTLHDKLEALRQLRDANKEPSKEDGEINKVIQRDFTGKQPYSPPETGEAEEKPSAG